MTDTTSPSGSTRNGRSYAHVLDFWLGPLDGDGLAAPEKAARWWTKDSALDATIRAQFEADRQAILAGEHEGWLDTPRGRLAYVIVLDQLSRNMYRGTPEMFSGDARALQVVLDGLDQGSDRTLATDERVFFYMPLMHSEDLAHQERCVALFEALCHHPSNKVRERIANNLRFALLHRDIVARFGRFPHRNAILGRETTPEEAEFLKQPGSSF